MTKIEMAVVVVILTILVTLTVNTRIEVTPQTPKNCVETGYEYRNYPILNCKGK